MYLSINSKTVISGIILAAVAVIMSIVIRVSFYGGYSTGGTSNLIAAMVAAGIPFWPAQFMGQMVSEIPDKIISVIFAYMIIQNMSARYKIKFPMGRLYVEG